MKVLALQSFKVLITLLRATDNKSYSLLAADFWCEPPSTFTESNEWASVNKDLLYKEATEFN